MTQRLPVTVPAHLLGFSTSRGHWKNSATIVEVWCPYSFCHNLRAGFDSNASDFFTQWSRSLLIRTSSVQSTQECPVLKESKELPSGCAVAALMCETGPSSWSASVAE